MCGIACILIGGNIDLSVAGQAALNAMIFAWLCQNTALPWPLVLLICIALAVCCGLANTLLVNLLKFPPFIATIGMASIYSGICNVITAGNNIQIARASFINMAKVTLWGRFPATFLFAIALIIVYQFILSRTTFGRSIICASSRRPYSAASRLSEAPAISAARSSPCCC
ncbi:MAG: hypothetical protein LBJ84_01685 [Oscillospiraceae bacterium]|jgi:ribose transport system permease protein|nr:hypothetical protein [Oscillospiraceae bacterium]